MSEKKLSINDVLKRLNKDKSEEDKVKLVSDQPDNFLKRQTIKTGSPYLDLLTGGWAKGGYNSIIAKGGAGKSSLALLAAKEEEENTGKITVYLDGEGTLDDSYVQRMGVNKEKLLVIKGRNLEEMLDTAEAFSTTEDVGLIIMDSVPIFTSTVVEAKTASDNNMAVEARKFSQRMPIIEGNCMRRSIGLLGLTSYKLDPAAMGDPRQLPRGLWQYTMGNTMIELTKKDILFNDKKEEVGHKLDIRVKKSKFTSYDEKNAYSLNFYYDGGFNVIDEHARLFVEYGIAKAGGAWISFPSKDAEEISVNGISKFIEHLKSNSDDYEFLKQQLNEPR